MRRPGDTRPGFEPKYDDQTPEQVAQSAAKPPAQADTRPVVTSMKPPRPGLAPEVYAVSDVYTERENLNAMRVTDPDRYARIVAELRRTGLLGARANSESSIDTAYKKLLQAASSSFSQGMPVTPQQARNILAGGSAAEGTAAGGVGGGRGGAYTGPVRSVTVQAETDIVASARAAAEELLGRMPTQQELDRILKRTRSAEQAQPTVQTRQGPGQITTAEGLTKEGRDNILRQVLMQSPDYQDYQIDSTVMDMMLTNLRRGQEVARG